MAHKIDNSKGFDAFVSRRLTAWHGLGSVIETVSTLDALQKGGLDFEVEKTTNIHRIPGGADIVSPTSFFTYRKDTLAVLGDHVGKAYTILQNRDALSIVDDYITNGGGIIETAGALNGGATTFLCVKAPEKIVVGKNDEVEQFVIFSNSHDGSRSVEAFYSPVRVVCANTLAAARSQGKNRISIRHTSGVMDNTRKALEILGIVTKTGQLTAEAFAKMEKTRLSKQEFFDYIGNLFFSSEEIAKLQKGERDVISTRKSNTVAKVLEYAEIGIGQAEAKPGSAWYAYNAVTGFLNNVKEFDSPSQRMESLLWKHSSELNARAFDLALNPGQIRPLHKINLGGDLSLN